MPCSMAPNRPLGTCLGTRYWVELARVAGLRHAAVCVAMCCTLNRTASRHTQRRVPREVTHAGGCALEEALVDFARAGLVRPLLDAERQVLDPVLDVEWVEADGAAPSTVRPPARLNDKRSLLEVACERSLAGGVAMKRPEPVRSGLRANALLRSSECNPHGFAVRVLGHDALGALRRSAPCCQSTYEKKRNPQCTMLPHNAQRGLAPFRDAS